VSDPAPAIAQRHFTLDDQLRFAAMSGDYNPIHVDPLKARRTQAGSPVVHGIHLLLWSLDALTARDADRSLLIVKASFQKFVYLDETIDLVTTKRTDEQIELAITAGGVARMVFTVRFGTRGPCPPPTDDIGTALDLGETPLELDIEEMKGRHGHIPFAARLADAEAMFPALAATIGAQRVAAIAATTCLVGMAYPGLHSIYSGLSLTLGDPAPAARDRLAFAVTGLHPRFRTLDLAVEGGGVSGTIATLVRRPPTPQASYESLKSEVAPQAFAGAAVLVVGGSRGLGELTAKLAAAGGASVIVTYAVGRTEAEAVASEIVAGGGRATTLRYDATEPAARQLAAAGTTITHAYYFATKSIFRFQADVYSAARFRELAAIYVDAFYDLAVALAAQGSKTRIFYPSTVFVAERPRGMTEYAMAKAAGETLCDELRATMPTLDIIATRLPRLLTDQTAAVVPVRTASALETILPVVREVQS
jgi:hypothetical protein